MSNLNFVIVTPVRDEEARIAHTISAVAKQTLKPSEWILVDDNSMDSTFEIIEASTIKYGYIRAFKYPLSRPRLPGGGVISAFNFGVSKISVEWDYLIKLDGDLIFEGNYFETLFQAFQEHPNLGIASGLILELDGKPVKSNFERHPFGASKVYSRACYCSIQPLEEIKSWDLIDTLKANVNGFETKIIRHATAIHLKPMESAVGKHRENFLKGYAASYLRYDPIFFLLKLVKTAAERPYVFGSFVYLCGFLYNTLFDKNFYRETEILKYLRNQQRQRIRRYLLILWRPISHFADKPRI